MRRWGVVVTAFYGILLAFFVVPIGVAVVGEPLPSGTATLLRETWVLTIIGLLVCGEALLLFVSVDTRLKFRRPRAHIALSAIVVAIAAGLLSSTAILSVLVAVFGDAALPDSDFWGWLLFIALLSTWVAWGVVFFRRYRSDAPPMTTIIDRLMKASVLELLIAVPAHVIVRQRQECSAPMVTGFGIATGIAVMLMCFGPGVLFLYRSRMQQRRPVHG